MLNNGQDLLKLITYIMVCIKDVKKIGIKALQVYSLKEFLLWLLNQVTVIQMHPK